MIWITFDQSKINQMKWVIVLVFALDGQDCNKTFENIAEINKLKSNM